MNNKNEQNGSHGERLRTWIHSNNQVEYRKHKKVANKKRNNNKKQDKKPN